MFETLEVRETPFGLRIRINRPDSQNSINRQLLLDLNQALDLAERDSKRRVVILEGLPGVFCTGMDFREVNRTNPADPGAGDESANRDYLNVLKRFTTIPKFVIAAVDGKVIAGGVGFAAACDLVFATGRSSFHLSEMLWGLLPACVTPFLIRRVGFQQAYAMTLTTQTVTAQRAHEIHLVDELADDLDEAIRRRMLRLSCIDEDTIRDCKAYFRKMWILTEAMEQTAVGEITRLVATPKVRNNIRNFLEHQRFPWESP